MLKIKKKKKIALCLSGGGPKAAAFHLGVCLALQEKGFKFIGGTHAQVAQNPHVDDPLAIKMYIGASAGAMVSALLASGHSIDEVISNFTAETGLVKGLGKKGPLRSLNYWDMFSIRRPQVLKFLQDFFKRKTYLEAAGIEATLKNYFTSPGLFSAKGIEAYLRDVVLTTNSFSELGVELYATATFLNESKKAVFGPKDMTNKKGDVVYMKHATISDGVAASLSLPPFFAPWRIKNLNGEFVDYYDGEIRETLSTHIATDFDADLVISSYSIQPYQYTKEVGSLSNFGLPLIFNQALYQLIEQKIDKSIAARDDVRALINTVMGYFRENNLPQEHAERLAEIMCQRARFNPDVDYIYIHPKATNYDMFFADHFSLNPVILAQIARIGFRSAISVLRKIDL